jgi:hypothetical protein
MHEDNDDHLKKLIETTMDEKSPGITFSKEINLGHVVVALTFLVGAFATYLSFHDSNLDHANRVKSLEVQQDRTDKTITQLATNQTQTEKAVNQLVWIVERIEKKENK